MKTSSVLTPCEAAEAIGVSYATLKSWILAGKIKTVRTAGGHHRIAASELDAFLPRQRKGGRDADRHRQQYDEQRHHSRIAEEREIGWGRQELDVVGERRIEYPPRRDGGGILRPYGEP